MNEGILSDFIDMILEQNSVLPYSIFFDNDYGDDEDMVCSFFSFLVSRCIIRYAPRYINHGVYVFSNPGRIIMKDKKKRNSFLKDFMEFYDST